MHSPKMIDVKLARVKARPPSARLLPMMASVSGTPITDTSIPGQAQATSPTAPRKRPGRTVSRSHLRKVTK